MLDKDQFTEVMRWGLDRLGLYSRAAERLLLGTAMQESRLTYLFQKPRGPAIGLFQMEPPTIQDTLMRVLEKPQAKKLDLKNKFEALCGPVSLIQEFQIDDLRCRLAGDVTLQVALARIKYWGVPEALPAENDILGMARYWKAHWNTHLGAGTEIEFMENYRRYIDKGAV